VRRISASSRSARAARSASEAVFGPRTFTWSVAARNPAALTRATGSSEMTASGTAASSWRSRAMSCCCERARASRGVSFTTREAALTLPCVPPPTVVKTSVTSGWRRTIASTRRVTSSVAKSDEPGGVLIAMVNWASSVCGRNSTPTKRTR